MPVPPAPSDDRAVVRLTGVYDAEGTLAGELRHLAGTLAGRHCALCDITHGRLRERAAWREERDRLPVPFTAVHLDERDPEVLAATEGRGACVVAHRADGGVELLLDTAALEACDGDPARFAAAVRAALEARG